MQLLWLVAEFIKVDVADVDDKLCVSLCRQVIASPSRERGAMAMVMVRVRVRVRAGAGAGAGARHCPFMHA